MGFNRLIKVGQQVSEQIWGFEVLHILKSPMAVRLRFLHHLWRLYLLSRL